MALLVLGALVGAPIAVIAYFFLKAVAVVQNYFYATLPGDLGFDHEPLWWPLPLLVLGGLLVGLTIRYLPGTAGHKPAEGLKTGAPRPVEVPGIMLAALATLSFGAVLGPEAPLIAMGGGLGVLAVEVLKRDAPPTAALVIGVAGSFAALSALLGSPLAGAFLLMEAAGVGGPLLGVVLVPGLLAAGVGALVFTGLNSWTGFGTFSLALPDLPPFGTPDGAEFLWAIGIGLAAALLGAAITRAALMLQPVVERRMVLLTPVVGVAIAGVAMLFAAATDRSSSEVLFSGQDALAPLINHAADWTVGALALLVACKSFAYAVSLSAFRGGPVFPGMFIGAAGGILLSHLPGLPMIAGVAMGLGAMTVAMLGLPLVSVLLPALFLQNEGLSLLPLVIVAVVVSYVVSARLAPARVASSQPTGAAPDADSAPPTAAAPIVATGSSTPAAAT